uniref:NADH dehydrogenase subunit 4L n=1 Tax=Friesea gretae TaxID=2779679 RepID=A0A899IJX0_9HEXA|nr:NADH dehydrogenase subunit 4L [Friesea gretae]QSL98429.1 NADH dehydrogenase subunit 4L [Friesea gretae]
MLSSLWISFIFGFMGFSFMMSQLLGMLLLLEFMVLLVFSSFMFVFSSGVSFIAVVFLVFSVCEGALGLTILVGFSRAFGGDYLNAFSLTV